MSSLADTVSTGAAGAGVPGRIGEPGASILIVDDRADNLTMLAEYLIGHDHELTLVGSGPEALARVAAITL